MAGKHIVNGGASKNMVSNKDLETPINDFQQLMAITAEECGELTQVCMKLLRKYESLDAASEDKHLELLNEEAGDVYAMIDLLCEHGVLQWEHIYARSSYKKEKLKQWSTLIRDD